MRIAGNGEHNMSLNLNGRFPCKLGRGALNESKNGALMYTVEVLIDDAEGKPFPVLMNNFVLVKKDGEVLQRNVDKLIALLGGQWDGSDPAQLEACDPSGIEAVATCGDREYDGKLYTEIKWLDPVGGGGRELPQQVDAKSIAAKYGSKFRALYGGKSSPAKPASTAPNKPAAPASKSALPPSKPKAPPSAPKDDAAERMKMANDAWSAMCAATDDMEEQARIDKWFELMEAHANTKDQTAVTCEQWKAIRNAIAEINGEALPF